MRSPSRRRLCGETLEAEPRILWTREMVTGAYRPTWAPVTLEDGTELSAIAFVADHANSQYEGDARAPLIAPLMAVASGLFGTNTEYVFKLQSALADCGLNDAYIDELVDQLVDELAAELARIAGQPA